MSNEIRLLNVCRTLQGEAATSLTDPFSSIGGSWSDAGTWVLNGVTTTGIITSNGSQAISGGLGHLYTGRYASQSISTQKRRQVTLDAPYIPEDGEISILMDMNNTTPVPGGSVRFRVLAGVTATGAIFWDLFLYCNETIKATRRIYLKSSASSMALAIDATNTARCYVNGSEAIAFLLPGYTAAGGRVGIALVSSATTHTHTDAFTFTYTVQGGALAVDQLPPRTLVASSNGRIYVQDKSGDMKVLGLDAAVVRTLASDRLLQSVNRYQKLYIADYGLKKYGQGTGSNTTTSFDDGGVGDWTASVFGPNANQAIDTDDDRLEIISGTGATPGVYQINSIIAGNLTLSVSPGTTGSSLYYRILRGPKVFNSADLTLTLFPLGTIGNQAPVGCTIVALSNDRLIWSGDSLLPHIAYLSKAGDPENYAYVSTMAAVEPGGAFVFNPLTTSGASSLADAVTAVIPYTHDWTVFAGYRSTTILRGDPTTNGRLDQLSPDIGIIDKFAYCFTPEQVLLGMSTNGLYLFPPIPNSAPEPLSRRRVPAELLDINTALYDVQLNFDIKNHGVNIFVSPKTAGATTHWWFDWGSRAFWKETYYPNHDPTASCVHTMDQDGTPTVLLGCRDGYIRRFVPTLGVDDDQSMPSTATLGPFGGTSLQFMLHQILMEMASQSGLIIVDVLAGDTPEKAKNSEPVYTFSIGGGGDIFAPAPENCRIRGGAFFLRLTNQTLYAWAMESLVLNLEAVSKRRKSV